MRIFFAILFVLGINFFVIAQFTDDFADGDYQDGVPTYWEVSTTSGSSDFEILDGVLQSSGPSSSAELFFSTAQEVDFSKNDVTWSFKVMYSGGAPSGSNNIRVYLVSDQADLRLDPKGYYLQLGESGSGDGIDLSSTISPSFIVDGDDRIADALDATIRVSRSSLGDWLVEANQSGGTDYQTVGAASNLDYEEGGFFGFVVEHTSARNRSFFIDSVTIAISPVQDAVAPMVDTIFSKSLKEIFVVFSEAVRWLGDEELNSFQSDGLEFLGATLLGSDTVVLESDDLENGRNYSLKVSSIEDLSGNIILESEEVFRHLFVQNADSLDVLINEFMPDPSSENPIPNAEYIELYNRSEKFIDLNGWRFADALDTTDHFGTYILEPDSFVILAESSTLFSDYEVVEVSTFRSLNNSGDSISLVSVDAQIIHQVGYSFAEDGFSWELVNPVALDYGVSSFQLCMDEEGGTPGKQNSVFDATIDTTPPVLESVQVISANEVVISFSEKLEPLSASNPTNYQIAEVEVLEVVIQWPKQTDVTLFLSGLQSQEETVLKVQDIYDLWGNIAYDSIYFTYIQTESADSLDLLISEFLPDPDPDGKYPEEFVELYNRSEKYIELSSVRIADSRDTSTFFPSYVLAPFQWLAISKSDTISGADHMQLVSLPTLNNSGDEITLIGPRGLVHQITYPNSDPGVSWELRDLIDPCITFEDYSYSIAADGATPSFVNSVTDSTSDTEAPSVFSYRFSDSLSIVLSEDVDLTQLSWLNFAETELDISRISYKQRFDKNFTVHFSSTLQSGTMYELVFQGVQDCSGNLSEPERLVFGRASGASFQELIITEIMSDPEPSLGLPEREYLEIYNASDRVIALQSLVLKDATNQVLLPNADILPGEFKVLTAVSAESQFVNSLPVVGFPALSNSGEALSIWHGESLIYSVEYSADWHDLVTDGGISLEMLDLQNACVEERNWASSKDALGGTPGFSNSMVEPVPDNFGPVLQAIDLIDSKTLKCIFGENLRLGQSLIPNLVIDPPLEVDTVFISPDDLKSIWVFLLDSLEENTNYALRFSDVEDCSGKPSASVDASVTRPVDWTVANQDDVLLSEVLFNPTPSGVDFVELFNNSSNYYSLSGWQVANENGSSVALDDRVIISPNQYLALSTSSSILEAEYPSVFDKEPTLIEVTSLPTFPNESGTVLLLSPNGDTLQAFAYLEDYHNALLGDVDGVSLERISWLAGEDESDNWRSAASQVGFATPGSPNSQNLEITAFTTKLQVEPKVFIPGEGFSVITYDAARAGSFANLSIYNHKGALIANLAAGESLASDGFFRWDGITDRGEVAPMGYYIILFEIFDGAGNTEVLKETVVVGRDL